MEWIFCARTVFASLESALKRDEIWLNRHRALASCLSMIFSENRFTLSGSCFSASSGWRRGPRVHLGSTTRRRHVWRRRARHGPHAVRRPDVAARREGVAATRERAETTLATFLAARGAGTVCSGRLTRELVASRVTRAASGILNTFGAGTGKVFKALVCTESDGRGHSASGGRGTPRECRTPCRSSLSCQSRWDSLGADSMPRSARTKFGILGQRAIATVSDGGCNCHCCGSVGVAGRSGVAGTT